MLDQKMNTGQNAKKKAKFLGHKPNTYWFFTLKEKKKKNNKYIYLFNVVRQVSLRLLGALLRLRAQSSNVSNTHVNKRERGRQHVG